MDESFTSIMGNMHTSNEYLRTKPPTILVYHDFTEYS